MENYIKRCKDDEAQDKKNIVSHENKIVTYENIDNDSNNFDLSEVKNEIMAMNIRL